ncbi:ABC transporter permease [Paenibacillus sp. BAC0078]
MRKLLWAERQKIRRSNIVWITVFATVMVAVIVFLGGQDEYDGSRNIDNAGWYMTMAQPWATFFVLPAVIALLGSYMICREEQEDTIKSLRLIPVNEANLTAAKMIVTFAFSILLYLLLFAITFLVEAILHFSDLSVEMVLGFLKAYFLDGLGIFLAISPIIAFVSRMKKGYWLALLFAEIYSFAGLFMSMSNFLKAFYPITAVFTISGYYDASTSQVLLSCISLLLCGCLSAFILKGLKHSKNN